MRRPIVIAQNRTLRQVLVDFLTTMVGADWVVAGPDLFETIPERSSTIIATTSDLRPEACRYLIAGHDAKILPLDPLASPESRRAYERTGASWMPMEVSRLFRERVADLLA